MSSRRRGGGGKKLKTECMSWDICLVPWSRKTSLWRTLPQPQAIAVDVDFAEEEKLGPSEKNPYSQTFPSILYWILFALCHPSGVGI